MCRYNFVSIILDIYKPKQIILFRFYTDLKLENVNILHTEILTTKKNSMYMLLK